MFQVSYTAWGCGLIHVQQLINYYSDLIHQLVEASLSLVPCFCTASQTFPWAVVSLECQQAFPALDSTVNRSCLCRQPLLCSDSVCRLVLIDVTGFLVMCIAPWLSNMVTVAWSCNTLRSDRSPLIHVVFSVAVLYATCSASAVESVTMVCFLLIQLTGPQLMRNMFPLVECQLSKLSAYIVCIKVSNQLSIIRLPVPQGGM